MVPTSGETRIRKNRYSIYFTLFCFAFGALVGLTQFYKGFFPASPDIPETSISSHESAESPRKLVLIVTDTLGTDPSTNELPLINERVLQGHGRFFKTRSPVTAPRSVPFHLWGVLAGVTPTLADTILRTHTLPESNLAQNQAVKRVVYDGLLTDTMMHSIVPRATRYNRRDEAEAMSWDMLIAHKSAGRIDRYTESAWNAVSTGGEEKGLVVVVGMNGGAVFLSENFTFGKENNEFMEVRLVDICPTIASLLGLEIPAGSTGSVISTLFEGEDKILGALNNNAEQLKKLLAFTSGEYDNEDDFMIQYNHSMSSYKRFEKHKTKKNFVSSLKHFVSVNIICFYYFVYAYFLFPVQ